MMVMASKTILLFLLIFSLHQCIIHGQPNHPRFAAILRAIARQTQYSEQRWNRLVRTDEIKLNTEFKFNNKKFPLYTFEGQNVQQMRVSEIFTMMQNWIRIVGPENNDHHFFEMNLGGEPYMFCLRQGPFGQIFFLSESGKMTEYGDIAPVLDENSATVRKEIAGHLLTSSNEPLGAQTSWPTDVISASVREKMRALMVISQVAEAARPSEDGLKALQDAVDEVVSFETEEESKIWQRDMKKTIRKLKRSKQYEELNGLKVNEVLKLFEPVVEDPVFRNTARDVLNGESDQTKFFELLPESIPNSESLRTELLNTGKSVIETANNRAGRKFNGLIRGLNPKSGRIPGADDTIRSVWSKMAESEAPTFREAFENDFILSQKDGTRLARQDIFQSVGSDYERPTQRPNPDIIAARDGARSRIEEAINKNLKRSCPGRRRRKRQGSCTLQRLMLDEETFSWKGDKLRFETIDEEGRRQSHEVTIDLDELPLNERVEEYVEDLERTGIHEDVYSPETALAVHGAIVNVFASIHHFSEGDVGEGAFTAAQAAHGIGSLTGFNDVTSKVTSRALERAFEASTERVGLTATVERVSEVGAKALGETASKSLSRLAGEVPIVGLVFDAKFIADDINELQDTDSNLPKSLRIAHLILDVETTVLTLVASIVPAAAPVLGPIILASTLIRLSIDNFYLDIQEELSKVQGQGWAAKFAAVLIGADEAIWDTLTLGLGRQQRQLRDRLIKDRELLTNLANPVSYFNVTFKGRDSDGEEVGTVDFTAGILSQHGGSLTLTMNDDGSFTVEFPEVPKEGGGTMPVKQTFTFEHPVNDVVLGIGQYGHPEYSHQEAKLWLVIPIESGDVIDRFETHQSSQHGTYYGNSHDNNFHALQGGNNERKRRSANEKVVARPKTESKRQTDDDSSCNRHSLNNFTIQLQSYHYDLYGRAGNDNFFLGPQGSRVVGGEDSDFYHIPSTGGRAIIDNFAYDGEMDTLVLEVSFSDIYCIRDGLDLTVHYCQTHSVRIEDWFSHGAEEFHRHLRISTADGVMIDVVKSDLDVDNHRTVCAAVSVDKSSSSVGVTVELTGSFSEVQYVHGSNFSDTIIGNKKANTISGGLGNDHLKGGNGADTYLVEESSGNNIINNFADDNMEDLLHMDIPYVDIAVESSELDLVLYSSSASQDTQVEITSWFRGRQWQHMTFTSSDYVMFTVSEDETDTPRKHPLNVNLAEAQSGVILDLMHPENSEGVTVNSEIADEVKAVFDSPHSDRLIGNMLGNLLQCSGGSDFLQGNGGKDTYVIDKTCDSATIQNSDQAESYDLLLFKCPSSKINLVQSSMDLIMDCSLTQTQSIRIIFQQWFNSTEYQHLMIKTSDKITAFLPETITELRTNQGRLFPVQIEKDEDCNGGHQDIDLSQPQFSKCERFLAKTDTCSYSVVGNNLKNYIDPGPGNPYGYQRLKGANGSDTYVMGHQYGTFNVIDNYAEDGLYDHLMLEVLFHDIEVSKSGMDAYVTSQSSNDSVRAIISNYFAGDLYQHLLVHSADSVLFKITEELPHIEVIIIDFSSAVYSQVIDADDNSTFEGVRVITGSRVAENHIRGGSLTTRITGGSQNDTIIGGPAGADLFGGDGDDVIYGGTGSDVMYGGGGDDFIDGGEGDDVIYAGMGADEINGGSGKNTVIFSGYNSHGVTVDLQVGLGWGADAEGDYYTLISHISGSDFDDTLIGNDDDNTIRGHGGDDFIYPAGGDDVLRGGRGEDIYYLNNAFGHKLIDNFATDDVMDIVVANNSYWEDTCYHFLGDDLQINFNSTGLNYSKAFQRVSLNEVFRMVTFQFWLENTTYQHVEFSFLDGYKRFEEFQDTSRQIQQAVDIVNNVSLFHVSDVRETGISLAFFYDDLLETAIATTDHDVRLNLVHFQLDSANYYPLSLSASSITRTLTLDSVTAGTRHSFSLALSSCGLTVAISPLVYATTYPSAPTDVEFETCPEDVHLEWATPNNDTNPFYDYYEYVVTIVSETERFERTTSENEISVFDLLPQTTYHISICVVVYNVTRSESCYNVTVSTSDNVCTNLQSLASHYLVGQFERNGRGEVVAFVTCDIGYHLEGDHRVVCNNTDSPLPQCTIVTCQVPTTPNAERTTGPDTPRHTDSVEWRCHDNFWVSAGVESFMSVCIDGTWRPPIKTCIEKPTCPPLTPPQNGKLNSTQHHVDDVISFICDIGHVFNGSPTKTCTLNEESNEADWSPTDEPRCHALECSLPSIPHARILSETSSPSHGDIVKWGCEDGYWVSHNLGNEFTSTCSSGSWSPPLESCIEKPTCQSLSSPDNGEINSTSFYVGDVVSYNCEEGYARQGPEVKSCLFDENTNTAVWSTTDETNCHALECSLPSTPHAAIQSESGDPSHGDTVVWRCEKDYWVSPGVTEFNSTCLAGSWNTEIESCVEKPRCSSPPVPTNGETNSTASTFHVDDVISYSCSDGYSFQGRSTVKRCTLNQNNGGASWQPDDEVSCNIIECSLQSISNARVVSTIEGSNPVHGETVFWECNNYYWVSYNTFEFSSTCLAGSWDPELESCSRIPSCRGSQLITPSNGRKNSTASRIYVGDAIRFSCNYGYTLSGITVRQCLYNTHTRLAYWSSTNRVTCNPRRCTLPTIANANRLTESNTPSHNDEVEWECHGDYWVQQDRMSTFSSRCSAGRWSPAIKTCVEKPRCPSPPVPTNGQINTTASVFHVHDIIAYSCDSGYHQSGVERITCQYRESDGRTYWDPAGSASCTAMRCPSLLGQTNGHYNSSRYRSYYTGDAVELTCNSGYYSRDSSVNPEKLVLRCSGTYSSIPGADWSPGQIECMVILHVTLDTLYVDRAVGTVKYRLSSLENTAVPSSLYGLACRLMIGYYTGQPQGTRSTRYRITYQNSWWSRPTTRRVPYSVTTLRCNTRIGLTGGATPYDGLLTIYTGNRDVSSQPEKVCVQRSGAARTACTALGYQQYTSCLSSQSGIETTLSISSSVVTNNTQSSCRNRIICRARCEPYSLPGCSIIGYEGNTCTARCNPGDALVGGSSSLTCISNGCGAVWRPTSGNYPSCDSEKWKEDIERESRSQGSRSHSSLASYLRDYLHDHYPNVYWVVIVYDDVTGWPTHTVRGSYYHLFRYHGHNIVVSRIRFLPGSSIRAPDNLENALSVSYSKREDCTTVTSCGWLFCNSHLSCSFNARSTSEATWDALRQRVSPVMLHVVRNSVSVSVSWWANSRYVKTLNRDGGFVTILAEH